MLRYVVLFGHEISLHDVAVLVAASIAFSYFSIALLKLNAKKWQIVLFVLLGFAIRYCMQNLVPGAHTYVWNTPPLMYFTGFGFLMVVLTAIFIKVFKWPIRKVLDHGIIALMMASSIARIGCFLYGCSSGKPSDLPWAVVFPQDPGVRVHPAQLYMLVLESMLWIFLIFFNKRKRYDGQTFWVGLMLYSIYKFGIEFIRTNPVFILGLTHTQIFTIATFFLSVGVLGFHRIKSRGEKA
jgi:prolipoprotein diacylglyceryltransferase